MSKFIDKVRVFVKGGEGGNGCLSFLSEKYREFAGPDGGDGGRGGDVVFVADPKIRTLLDFAHRPHVEAERGQHGKSKNKTGASASEHVVWVPIGTVVIKAGLQAADLASPGDRFVAAKGGRGGRGNLSFKTQGNTAPRLYERGEPGESAELVLELKLIADVGLVGFPNAGKSSLLARVSNARPKIADYPFTTLSPNLGIVQHKGSSFVMADIPGLIEGAHEGRGLGGDFLRHVERTRVLAHLVDPLGYGDVSAEEGVLKIEAELKAYSPVLARTPKILVLNKTDLPEAAAVLKALRRRRRNVFAISAATGEGVGPLLDRVLEEISRLPEKKIVRTRSLGARTVKVQKGFRVGRQKNGDFVVSGVFIERAAAMADPGIMESLYRLQKTFKRIGVDRELKARGVKEGDTVRIGPLELAWSYEPLDKLPRLPRRRQIKGRP